MSRDAVSSSSGGAATQAEMDDEPEFGPARPPAAAAATADEAVPMDTSGNEATAASAASAPTSAATAVARPLDPYGNPLRRVKMYRLGGGTGQWEDSGTGFLSYMNMRTTKHTTVLSPDGREITNPAEAQFGFVVTEETPEEAAAAAAAAEAAASGTTAPAATSATASSASAAVAGASTTATPADVPVILLSHLLHQGTDYQVQSDTIITWCMVDTGADVALSFQEGGVCEEAAGIIEAQRAFLNPPTPMPKGSADELLDAGMGLQIGLLHEDCVGMEDLRSGGDPFAMQQQDMLAAHEALADNSRRLYDDYSDAPPVSLDTMPSLTSRLATGQQRICRREIRELISIWQAKEEEFVDLLQEERRDFEEEQRAHCARRAARAPSSTQASAPSTPTSTGAVTASSLGQAGHLSPASTTSAMHGHASPSGLTNAGAPDSPPSSPSFSAILVTLGQLQTIFRCVKALLLTNDVEVLEILFSDAEIGNLVGMLEYDPLYADHPVRSHQPRDFKTHRTFLATAVFKHVLPFHDPIVEHKVHQSYRITYLKDVVLANHLDDATLTTFTQILFFNMVSIISRLTDRKEFLEDLFKALNKHAQVDFTVAEHEKERVAALERQSLEDDDEDAGQVNASLDSLQSDSTQPLVSSPSTSNPTTALTSSSSHGLATTQSLDSASSQTPLASASLVACAPSAASLTPSSSEPPAASLKTLLLFLQELVLQSKNVQVPVRDAFYRALEQNSLFEVLEAILVRDAQRQRDELAANPNAAATAALSTAAAASSAASSSSSLDSGGETAHNWLWLISTDIISNICIHDATFFRTYLISAFGAPPGTPTMLSMMVGMFAVPNLSTSLAHQLSCLIRLVLDPEAMSAQDQYLFLGRIYEDHLARLLAPLAALQPSHPDEDPFAAADFSPTANPLTLRLEAEARSQRDAKQASFHVAAYHAIELLSYCALHHNAGPERDLDGGIGTSSPDFFRKFAIKHRVLPTVLLILRTTRRNDLVCSAIRFFRICLGSRDRFYTHMIIQANLFEPVLMHFAANGPRYNLLNSVVCELFHFLNETHRAGQKQQTQALFNPNSIVFLGDIIRGKLWTKYRLDRVQYVRTFQESKAIWTEHEHREREMKMRADEDDCFPRRLSLDRSMSSSISEDDCSANSSPYALAAASRQHNKFTVRSGGGGGSNGNGNDRITKRRKDRHSRRMPDQVEIEMESKTLPASSIPPQPQQGNSLLSADYYADDEPLPASDASPSSCLPLDAYSDPADADSLEGDSPRPMDRSFDSDEIHSQGDDTEDTAGTPSRRIVFVSDDVKQSSLPNSAEQPIRRRSQPGKRKSAALGADDDLPSEASFPSVSSPPHSPVHTIHSVAVPLSPRSKLVSSELPPTAQRSPELSALPSVASPSSSSSTSSGPPSPPRQITPLDLADADAISSSPQRSPSAAGAAAAAALASPLHGRRHPSPQPRRMSAPVSTASSPATAAGPLSATPSSPPQQATKRRRLEAST